MSEARSWSAPPLAATVRPSTRELEHRIEQSRQAAEHILAQARAQAGEIREAARREGFAEGLAAGKAEAHERQEQDSAARAEHLEQALAALQHDLEQRWQSLLAELEQEVGHLALALAEKLAGATLGAVPAGEVIRAVELFSGSQDVAVRVHPLCRPQIEGKVPIRVRLETDETLYPGDFVVTGPAGEVDGRVATRRRKLEEFLGVGSEGLKDQA